MDIAVYGGSFDPPHVGHGLVAAWVLWTGRAQAVWLVPSFDHPFGKERAWSYDDRVAMCQALAASVGPGVSVSRVEQTLPTPSYTVDVLQALIELVELR